MDKIELYKNRLSTTPGDFAHYMKIDNICDFGYVQFIEYMGSDYQIAKTAKMCFGKYDDNLSRNGIEHMINQLMKKGHTSPFEFAKITFRVKAPIFVARQWFRHRTFQYMERSGRYTDLSRMECYCQFQDEKSIAIANQAATCSILGYAALLERKESMEEARTILPLGMFTEFLFSADLHNLLHFLKLRLSPGAQKEMRDYATAVATIVQNLFPITWDAFEEHVLYAKTISRSEQPIQGDNE